MKVLVSAYYCEPGKGSEQGIGWGLVQQIAKSHDVWVLTPGRNRASIAPHIDTRDGSTARFVYVDVPLWTAPSIRRSDTEIHYYLWQVAAYFAGLRLNRVIHFDLIHHVTMTRYWSPSFLSMLPTPFVWGPVGGGESAPVAFWSSFGFRGKLHEATRALARKISEHDPFLRRTAREASIGLATSEETASRMRRLGCGQVSVLSSVGLDRSDLERLFSLPLHSGPPFRLVSIGRLLHWKGFHLSLRAFASFHRQCPESEYWIFGDGPERTRLEKLARDLEVSDKVTIWGTMVRTEVLKRLSECDVLIHPSLHESGGWVCLEAMAAGRPVVCLNLGGPALQVTRETGIKVRPSSELKTIDELTRAISRLAKDAPLRLCMGSASRQRVKEHFDWANKARILARTYQAALRCKANDVPSFS